MSDIVYGYFKAETPKGPGYVCIRLKRPPKDSGGRVYHYSCSFCSPNDQFCRKTAREIASHRMDLNKNEFIHNGGTAKDLLAVAFAKIDNVPTWLKKAKKVERHFRSRKREKVSKSLSN